jgi:hypothetical protein
MDIENVKKQYEEHLMQLPNTDVVEIGNVTAQTTQRR